MNNKNENIGALWIKQSTKGEFFSGNIKDENDKEYKIVIFKNGYKEKENQPDYNIYKSKPREEFVEIVENNNILSDDDLPF